MFLFFFCVRQYFIMEEYVYRLQEANKRQTTWCYCTKGRSHYETSHYQHSAWTYNGLPMEVLTFSLNNQRCAFTSAINMSNVLAISSFSHWSRPFHHLHSNPVRLGHTVSQLYSVMFNIYFLNGGKERFVLIHMSSDVIYKCLDFIVVIIPLQCLHINNDTSLCL